MSREAINIDGLSNQTLQKFIDLSWVKSFPDIMNLSDYRDEMGKVDGFGKRSVEKILTAINGARKTTLDRFIYSLSIPMIGRTASKTIADYFNYDVEAFMGAWSYGFGYDWTKLDDIGSTMHTSMAKYFLENTSMIQMMRKEFEFEIPGSIRKENNFLKDRIFVITGKLECFKNRKKLVSEIEKFGGKVSDNVSNKTSFLINNDIGSTSGKNKKAKSLDIPIISEEDFKKIVLSGR